MSSTASGADTRPREAGSHVGAQGRESSQGDVTANGALAELSRLATTAPVDEDLTLTAVGDLIYLRPLLPTLQHREARMLALLADADVVYGNLETNVFDLTEVGGGEAIVPEAASGGTWMHAAPAIVDDVVGLGFTLLAGANNHAGDWGRGGMLATMGHLGRAGLELAGLGETMSEATLPRYLDIPKGRIGHVSTATTFTPHSRAADPAGVVPGRGGVNAIRLTPVTALDAAAFASLEILCARAGGMAGRVIRTGEEIEWQGARFVRAGQGEVSELEFRVDDDDLRRNLKAVRQARQNSNFTIFSIHSHEPFNESQQPTQALVDIARAGVDAGADLVLCHGPHQLRGVEIYAGSPIVYSLGNFFMMNNSLDVVPPDFTEGVSRRYDASSLDTLTVPEQFATRNSRMFAATEMFESAIFRFRFAAGGVLSSIRAYPVELGIGSTGADVGVPRRAHGALAARILNRLAALSQERGTTVRLGSEDGWDFAEYLHGELREGAPR